MKYNTETDEFTISFFKDILTTIPIIPAVVKIPLWAGRYELTGELAMVWVRERLVPPNRQNIDDILESLGLEEYSEIGLLSALKGKCCQDDLYLEELYEEV